MIFFNLAKFRALLTLLGSFANIFGVGVRCKKFIGTYLCKQSTLVFVFDLATFGAFFAILWPFGAIFEVGDRSKQFFGTYLNRLKTFILEV